MVGRKTLLAVGAVGFTIATLAVVRRRAAAAGVAPRRYAALAFRHFVTFRFDPAVQRLGLVGGRRSPWALLEHVGRVSGTIRRTPVVVRLTDTAAFIPLPYGTDVQWAQNVLAAGHCRIQVHERVYELDEARLVGGSENLSLRPLVRRAAERAGNRYLALRRVADAPGRLETPGAAAAPLPEPALPADEPEAAEPRLAPAGRGIAPRSHVAAVVASRAHGGPGPRLETD